MRFDYYDFVIISILFFLMFTKYLYYLLYMCFVDLLFFRTVILELGGGKFFHFIFYVLVFFLIRFILTWVFIKFINNFRKFGGFLEVSSLFICYCCDVVTFLDLGIASDFPWFVVIGEIRSVLATTNIR